MSIQPFKPWQPDLAPLLGGSLVALNTLPVEDGYAQMPMPVPGLPNNFLTSPLKLFVAKASDGQAIPLCLGVDSSAIATNTGWVTLNNSLIHSDSWDAVTWGDAVYAVNDRDPYKKFDIIAGVSLDDVPTATTGGITGRRIAIVGDFIMLIDISLGFGATRFPYRAQWSGLQRPEIFIPDPAIQSDFQDVSDIGKLQAILGGEYGVILGEFGSTRVDYVGGDVIFTFQTIEVDVGCDIPLSAVRVGDICIWHSKRGWRRATAGGVSQGIGVGICDKYFANRVDMSAIAKFSFVVFNDQDVVLFSYVSIFSPDGKPDEVLAYNWRLNRWTPGKMRVDILGQSIQAPSFTDDAVILLPGWTTGSFTDDFMQITDAFTEEKTFIASMLDGALAPLNNIAGQSIVLQTEEFEVANGNLAKLVRFRPIINGAGSVTATVRTRDNQLTDMVYNERIGLQLENDGSFRCNERGRYHSIELDITTPLRKGIGIDIIDAFRLGKR